MNGISALIRVTGEFVSSLSSPSEAAMEDGLLQTRKWGLTRHKSVSALILGSAVSRTMRNKRLLFKPLRL